MAVASSFHTVFIHDVPVLDTGQSDNSVTHTDSFQPRICPRTHWWRKVASSAQKKKSGNEASHPTNLSVQQPAALCF